MFSGHTQGPKLLGPLSTLSARKRGNSGGWKGNVQEKRRVTSWTDGWRSENKLS